MGSVKKYTQEYKGEGVKYSRVSAYIHTKWMVPADHSNFSSKHLK